MKTNKFIQFLLLKPVFSSRNLTSIALVALFVAVYVLAGGKITTVPKVSNSNAFGGIETKEEKRKPVPAQRIEPAPQRVEPSSEGSSISGDISDILNNTAQGNEVNTQPTQQVQPQGNPSGDSLSAIEERLKGLSVKGQ